MKDPDPFTQSVRRLEDKRFITGTATFIDDVNLPGQAYAALLRSSRAHARIAGIDVSKARAAAGALLVVTGKDWVAAGHGPIPTKMPIRTKRDGSPFHEPKHHCLAVDAVHHVGEAVALVVAETRAQAEEALELIEVDYEDLPAVTHQTAALGEGAPQLWPEAPGNFCMDYELGNRAAVEEAFAKADHVVTLDLVNNRVTGVPLEPRGVVGVYDRASDTYTLWNASQNIHANREIIAQQIANIPAAKVRHVAPDVGGGFGAKNPVYPEPSLLLFATRQVGRPVKWVATRSEAFLSDAHGPRPGVDGVAGTDEGRHLPGAQGGVGGQPRGLVRHHGPVHADAGHRAHPGRALRLPGDALQFQGGLHQHAADRPLPRRRPAGGVVPHRAHRRVCRAHAGVSTAWRSAAEPDPAGPAAVEDADGAVDRLGNFPALFERALQLADYAGFPQRAAEAQGARACTAASRWPRIWNAPAARPRRRPR